MPNTLKRSRLGQRGQSFVEVLITITIVAIAAQAGWMVIRAMAKGTVAARDRAFATEKALQMMEEVRGLVLDGQADIRLLDYPPFNDGRQATAPFAPNLRYTLTTEKQVTHPGGVEGVDASVATHPLSGNPITGRGYAYVRHIDVQGVVGDSTVRKVWVRVYKAETNTGTLATTAVAKDLNKPLAEIFSLVTSKGTQTLPSQQLDFYLVAIENTPAWWVRFSQMRPLMVSVLNSLMSRNPGLRIKDHWISRNSFGRDPEYTPELNSATYGQMNGAFKKTYIYPGSILFDTAGSNNTYNYADQYYFNEAMEGRINVDGTVDNRKGYAYADQFNHAVRYPEERRLYEMLCQTAANNGLAKPEISLRMLMEAMNNNDPNYRNAVIINLHAELMPVPPLRNVSDAAKDPAYYFRTYAQGGRQYDSKGDAAVTPTLRAFRAVSHSERLMYNTAVAAQNTPAFRVYAYDMNPTAIVNATSLTVSSSLVGVSNENDLIDYVTVFIPGATLANLKAVERVQGNSYTPYYKHRYSGASNNVLGNWPARGDDQSWVADEFTPGLGTALERGPGLRITFKGVTPTARVYTGPAYQP